MTDDTGPVLTLGQAVKTTGVARSTLQRRLAADAIPGALRADNGQWAIPVSGLIAAGLAPRTTPADEPAEALEVDGADDTVNALRADNERLRADLAHSRELADERARTVETLTQALDLMARALPTGTPAPVAETPEPWSRNAVDGTPAPVAETPEPAEPRTARPPMESPPMEEPPRTPVLGSTVPRHGPHTGPIVRYRFGLLRRWRNPLAPRS